MFSRILCASVLLIVFIIVSGSYLLPNAQATAPANKTFYPYDSGIVYLLPSSASTPYWASVYGDRTAFYVHANISLYRNGILRDLDIISKHYRFIVMIVPLDDSAFFYYNLRLMDSWAAEKDLKVLYAFFPKSEYGPEDSYLITGTAVHEHLIRDMQFVARLPSTSAIAVWYGWKNIQMKVQEIEGFYNSLPQDLKGLYCVWLDGSFVRDAAAAGLPKLVDPLNITVVTELYSADILSQYGFAFKRQMIVSGSAYDETISQWQDAMVQKLSYVHSSLSSVDYSPRKLIVWTFWDKNDGSGEQYTAYLNGVLSNPLLASTPTTILLDQASPTSARVNVGSVVSYAYHFSWPDEFNATNIAVNINETEYLTDANGWITFTASSDRVAKLVLFPESAKWGPCELKVAAHAEVPEVIFDRVLIQLFAYPNPAEIGDNITIVAQGIYAYDGTPFQGKITLNHIMNNTKPGMYTYATIRIEDPLYGLTTFDSNVLTLTIYEKPLNLTDRISLLDVLAVLLIATGACFGAWVTWRRFNLKRKSVD